MNYCWNVKTPDQEKIKLLCAELGISFFFSKLLVSRGLSDINQVKEFLSPTLDKLPNPFLLKGMEKSVERIIQAIESSEKIAIYGDFDCDGITSTAILYDFLKRVEGNAVFYNPQRIEEGYGINFKSIEKLSSEGVTLIISTDCGISENEVVEKSKTLNIDFIITDHHTAPEILPEAVSIVNPKQSDCEYPFKEICAAGVVFNLIMALRSELRKREYFEFIKEPNLKRYLDLVAIATIADSMPITNINRIFVSNGLNEIPKTDKKGLLALIRNNDKKKYSTRDVSFQVAPKINAAGRVGKATNAVKLLVEENPEEINSLVAIIDQDNSRRQKIQEQVLTEAISMSKDIIKQDKDRNSLVLSSEDWHPGVIGIVASKISENFSRPCAIISLKNGIGKGSLRTRSNINLYQVLKECESTLVQYGGHSGAAGITIDNNEIENFSKIFESSVQNYEHKEEERFPDIDLDFDEINSKTLIDLQRMEPFGRENENPTFVTHNLKIKSKKILKEKHLEIFLEKEETVRRAIWFNFSKQLNVGDTVDIIYRIQKDNYSNYSNISLIVEDLRST
ncbi:MAG: single-stranded-DNA-specific exonuclease RecJ [Thermodesulfobacteriota bacterium]|nr:single-stranded-DNA-specific exonuclease RecJ [Thermodesulfobacteriota bacterium]